MENSWYFILIFSLFFPSVIKTNEVPSHVIHEQNIFDYIHELYSYVDSTKNPCEDFTKYACGKLESVDEYLNFGLTIEEKFDSFFNKWKPQTKAEQMVYDFNIRCRKDDMNIKGNYSNIPEIWNQIEGLNKFKTFPVQTENVNVDNVSELWGQVDTFPFNQIFLPFWNSSTKLTLKLRFTPAYVSEDVLKAIGELHEVEEDLLEKTKVNIENFMNQIRSVKTDEEEATSIEFSSLTELKNALPSKHLDWEKYFKAFKKNLGVDVSNIKLVIEHPNVVKKVLKVVDETSLETIANYQIYNFIYKLVIDFTHLKCGMLNAFGRYLYFNKIWNQQLTTITIERINKFLTEFIDAADWEVQFKEIPKLEFTKNKIAKIQEVLKIYKDLVDSTKFEEYYKEYENLEFYPLMLKIFYDFAKKVPLNFDAEKQEINFWRGEYDDVIPFNIRDKPYLYYYTTLNFNLWFKLFENNHVYNSSSVVHKCLEQIGENFESLYDESHFMASYAAVKAIVKHYKESVTLTTETPYINKMNEDITKLLFIGLAQHQCRQPKEKKFDYIIRSFKYTEMFANAFSCPSESKMNRNQENFCDTEHCEKVSDEIAVFLPYHFKKCE